VLLKWGAVVSLVHVCILGMHSAVSQQRALLVLVLLEPILQCCRLILHGASPALACPLGWFLCMRRLKLLPFLLLRSAWAAV
jgi:hypothetical protein